MTYSDLARLPASAYLSPETFRTSWDTRPAYAEEQRAHGLEMGRKGGVLVISCRSVWTFKHADGSTTSSSEGIGYHAHTADLLQGFLDSGCRIEVWRFRGGLPAGGLEHEVIRPGP